MAERETEAAPEQDGAEAQEQPACRVGAVGVKCGMSRVFTEDGRSLPVTLVRFGPNRVLSCGEKNVRVAWGEAPRKIAKPDQGVYRSAGVPDARGVVELRLPQAAGAEALQPGAELSLRQFSAGDAVDVTARSRGKGFAGTVKRWNFRTQDNSHGNSLAHRKPGSIGQCQTPGKVWKGKKMAGHMGDRKVTVQNLEVVQVDLEGGMLSICGAVPGAPGAVVLVRPAVKGGSGQ